MKPDYTLNDLLVDSEFIETENSGMVKYTFASFEDLEKFWEGSFDYFNDRNDKTKVIGTTLYVFKGKLE